MKCSLDNETELFSNCTNISIADVHKLALVRGATGIVCFVLCVATFIFELFYICQLRRRLKKDERFRKSEGTTTLQRLFVYLTFSNILYTVALSLHIEEYFPHQKNVVDCFVCRVVGFFDQYSGSVQLLLTVGISVKLLHKLKSKPQVVKGVLSRHHFKFEALFVFLCFFLPLVVIWVPFTQRGAGDYGLDGAWCWIQVIQVGCHRSRTAFLEQLFLWYVPFAVISLLSLFCIAAIIVFLAYIYLCHKSSKNISRLICDMLLLLPFLVVFSCVCLVEVTILPARGIKKACTSGQLYYVDVLRCHYSSGWCCHPNCFLFLPPEKEKLCF